jgi:acetylornithine deacetylase/succinyl-diaminopimelate desuccinylase-like protein
LRGICIIDLTVEIGTNAYHSGEVGGIVPETFRVVRQLLDRIDDPVTGKPMSELETELPQWKNDEAEFMVKLAGDDMCKKYSIVEGARYCSQDDLKEMYLNNQWRANLSITGADGLPPIAMAGNAVRASTSVRLSMRLPPNMDPAKAQAAMEKKLTEDVPYGAKVTLKTGHSGSGWCMSVLHPWLDAAIKKAGTDFYDGKPSGSYGMGGSIPFLSEIEKMYPNTQIVAFGLLGPNSNAHGPNESINLPYTKKLTCALSHVMQAAAEN